MACQLLVHPSSNIEDILFKKFFEDTLQKMSKIEMKHLIIWVSEEPQCLGPEKPYPLQS